MTGRYLHPSVGGTEWADQGRCHDVADGDIFFPERGRSVQPAKALCRNCPVQQPCLEYALANNERFGVWGGLSERERRRHRRAQ